MIEWLKRKWEEMLIGLLGYKLSKDQHVYVRQERNQVRGLRGDRVRICNPPEQVYLRALVLRDSRGGTVPLKLEGNDGYVNEYTNKPWDGIVDDVSIYGLVPAPDGNGPHIEEIHGQIANPGKWLPVRPKEPAMAV